MTIAFSRPNAAFRAYERSLLRPVARPAPRDTPTLWQRAKAMFSATLEKVSALASLAQRHALSRPERHDILTRLVPVEKLTRALLAVEAAVFLLMTPAGMKLRRAARIMAMPSRTPPEPVRHVLYGGWNYQRTPFPVPPPAAPIPARKSDPQDPSTWRCTFTAARWINPHDDTSKSTRFRKKPGPRPRLISFDELVSPAKPPPRKATTREEGAGAPLARRIEALSRVLENPDRAIRRIARLFAGAPSEILADAMAVWINTRRWHHGQPEFSAARALATRAMTVVVNARPTESEGLDPEPG
jgi:hypothetical protein